MGAESQDKTDKLNQDEIILLAKSLKCKYYAKDGKIYDFRKQ